MSGFRTALVGAMVAGAAPQAAAESWELGAFLGPHVFSHRSALGHIEGIDTSLSNSVVVGGRIGYQFASWFTVELELPMSPTTTRDYDVDVFWLSPRLQARFDATPQGRLSPFVLLGGGMQASLSEKRGLFAADVAFDGYTGGGFQFQASESLELRLDGRAIIVPAYGDTAIAAEFEVGIGARIPWGGARKRPAAPPADTDQDQIDDEVDQCLERAEDHDGFEDRDGCPEIDNDLDAILDMADKCRSVAETYNGFEDENGCPDAVPPEVDALVGTLEGVVYDPGVTAVPRKTRKRLEAIAGVLKAHPSVRVVVIGHADDREALPRGEVVEVDPGGEVAAPDHESLSKELSVSRAKAVERVLAGLGVDSNRIDVEGRGHAEPLSDRPGPRGRRSNRRVEIRLFVPMR